MPVPVTIADLTTSEATNSPLDSESVTATTRPSDYLRAHAAIIKTHSDLTAAHGATGAVVGTTNTQTLTSKTVNLASNTLTGTTAQFNTALSDGDFATLAGTETLTNKTLTSPTLTTPALGTPASGDLRNCSLAVAPAIGGTTPAAGAFTTLSASGLITSNGQIKFPATQNASADANTLDDYEEGAWSAGSSALGNLSSVTINNPRYTKFGRIVTLSCDLSLAVTAGSTLTYFVLAGFPFSAHASSFAGSLASNGTVFYAVGGVTPNSTTTAFCYFPAALVSGSGTEPAHFTLTYTV